MNDVLKSLTILEEGGGKVTGLRYDSSEPLARKLAAVPVPARRAPAAERAAGPAQRRAGRIDAGRREGGGRDRGRARGGRRREAAAARAGLAGARGGRPADFRSGGRHGRALHRPGAAIPAQGIPGQPGGGALQGEAQRLHRFHRGQEPAHPGQLRGPDAGLEIQLPADLPGGRRAHARGLGHRGQHHAARIGRNVRLALVSGRPVSFISRLYEPRYVQRQVAELPEEQAAAPEMHEGAVGGVVGGAPEAPPSPAMAAPMVKTPQAHRGR